MPSTWIRRISISEKAWKCPVDRLPGWVATVDGKPAPIHEAYTFLRGVVVEAGRHRVDMRYRPKSVYWGGALTALGLLSACTLRAFSRDGGRSPGLRAPSAPAHPG